MTHPGHLIVAPIVLPLLAGALLLLLEERGRALKSLLSVATLLALLVIAIVLLAFVDGSPGIATYRVGNWATPFGIVLVLDRLSALMLVLTALLAVAAHLFALARWSRAGPHFHSLLLFLLVGLNGAFLTGDLFNLFVFLEVLLAASYGLLLHGSGLLRVRAGLHYIAVNVVGASLLLVGISLLYGVTGTLNIADLALRVPALSGTDLGLAQAGVAILGVGLLVKVAAWPLGFWMVPAYTAASTPVSAIFAIMTKVGVYAILRLWLPLFGPASGAAGNFGGSWLLAGGLLTLAFGLVGVLSAQTMSRLVGYSVAVSSGTLLAVIGAGQGQALGGVLFYLISSTLGIAAFFLLIELVERGREPGADVLAVTREAFGDDEAEFEAEVEVGIVIPASIAFLGLSFACCALVLAGLPPMPGFVAKFSILTSLLNMPRPAGAPGIAPIAWVILALLLTSGLVTVIASTRVGIRALWTEERQIPHVALLEALPITFLLLLCFGLTFGAGHVIRYAEDTARYLQSPGTYIESVLGRPNVTAPARMTAP